MATYDVADPVDMAVGPDGNLYVSNRGGNAIERFDAITGQYLGPFVDNTPVPHGITFGPDGMLYVASWTEETVSVYDGSTGEFDGVLGGSVPAPKRCCLARTGTCMQAASPTGES